MLLHLMFVCNVAYVILLGVLHISSILREGCLRIMIANPPIPAGRLPIFPFVLYDGVKRMQYLLGKYLRSVL